MDYGLKQEVKEKIQSIFANFSVVETVIIYGSRAKGNYKPASDIDLTLIGKDISVNTLHKIELELDDLLLPITIDLSIFNKISNLDLIDHINRVGQVFYQKSTS